MKYVVLNVATILSTTTNVTKWIKSILFYLKCSRVSLADVICIFCVFFCMCRAVSFFFALLLSIGAFTSLRTRTIIGKGALSASRRLIESFSLSHTKDAPMYLHRSLSVHGDIRVRVYTWAMIQVRGLGCLVLPRFEYAITHITLFLFVFLPFFRLDLAAARRSAPRRSLNTNSFR